MNKSSLSSQRLTWKKFALIALVLLLAAYRYYADENQPVAENRPVAGDLSVVADNPPSADRPTTKDRTGAGDRPESEIRPAESNHSDEPFLQPVSGDDLQSPAGLLYGMGGGGEHRLDHVMRHARDDLSRPAHGVFDGDQTTILKLIDEAYQMVKDKSKYVKAESSQGNQEYTISIGRKIGFEGGEKGQRSKNRPLRVLRLILDGNRVITAYPFR